MKINPAQKITPFLWFDTEAEEAARFYTTVFENSRITIITRYGDAGPGPKGSVMTVGFELKGQKFTALNAGPVFKFNEAISFVVNCDTQDEIDRFWDLLTAGGGAPGQCGWLKDRFGLSWQIVPAVLPELVAGTAGDRVMCALMAMTKLDLVKLENA